MAYIRKLPSGKWQATVRHPAGHRLTMTDSLKKAVKDWSEETEAALRRGVTVAHVRSALTLGEWLEQWLGLRQVDPITTRKWRSLIKVHISPQWASWPLPSITRHDVQTWVTKMTRAGAGPDTVHAAYNLLAGILADAVGDGLLAVSPCRDIDMPKIVRPAPRWLTREEYGRIQLALGDIDRGHVHQAYVGLACYSGLRPGELAGLDTAAVDFERSLVWVSQVLTREGLRAYPKSDSSRRAVPFPPDIRDLLWRLCADRSVGPVFTTAQGARFTETNWRDRVWRPALATAGVERARPYITRHTCASWLVQDGVPPYDIAKMLGHSSTRLVDLYAHLAPTAHDRIRAAWQSSSSATQPPTAQQTTPSRIAQ